MKSLRTKGAAERPLRSEITRGSWRITFMATLKKIRNSLTIPREAYLAPSMLGPRHPNSAMRSTDCRSCKTSWIPFLQACQTARRKSRRNHSSLRLQRWSTIVLPSVVLVALAGCRH